MSDFDKEAERERLREKYGEEEQDREATEQMSELLLKGATMTNAHCNNCGDPIFRYDGQEFCPTCQQPVDRGDADGDDAADNENIEVTTPSDEATVQFGGADQEAPDQQAANQQTPEAEAATQEPADPDAASQQAPDQRDTADAPASASADDTTAARDARSTQQRSAPSSADDRGQADETRTAPSLESTAPSSRGDDRGTAPRAPEAAAGDATGHLTNAQALLAQTVERYAQQARDADSPRQAREYLEAAREAAETLEATGY
jgi:uncharacterized Zn finger protein (UPF0148 family)